MRITTKVIKILKDKGYLPWEVEKINAMGDDLFETLDDLIEEGVLTKREKMIFLTKPIDQEVILNMYYKEPPKVSKIPKKITNAIVSAEKDNYAPWMYCDIWYLQTDLIMDYDNLVCDWLDKEEKKGENKIDLLKIVYYYSVKKNIIKRNFEKLMRQKEYI